MDSGTSNALATLKALVERNISEIAKLATFVETMSGHIEQSFISAESDFTAMAEEIAEIKYNATEFRIENHGHSNRLHTELSAIRAELTDIKLEVATHADYAQQIDHILSRVSAIEKHLGIANEIAA